MVNPLALPSCSMGTRGDPDCTTRAPHSPSASPWPCRLPPSPLALGPLTFEITQPSWAQALHLNLQVRPDLEFGNIVPVLMPGLPLAWRQAMVLTGVQGLPSLQPRQGLWPGPGSRSQTNTVPVPTLSLPG